MKIDKSTLSTMEQDLIIVANHLKLTLSELNTNDINNLWFYVYCNRNYNTENHNVIKINEVRLLSQINDFELYPCNTNDISIYTAWKYFVNKWSK
jgi:hypothetical protein